MNTPHDPAQFLYRGLNADLYAATGGALTPKLPAEPFTYVFRYDGSICLCGSATYSSSEQNAVFRHEFRQEGYPTSGLSFTPHLSRARLYATHNGRYTTGWIVEVDRSRLSEFGVREHVVAKLPNPSKPEDDEVILVAPDFGPLPQELVVRWRKVTS